MIRFMSILLIVFISADCLAKSSSRRRHCIPSESERVKSTQSMKYDRCSYKRVGNVLVGDCTSWDGTMRYTTTEEDVFTSNKVDARKLGLTIYGKLEKLK